MKEEKDEYKGGKIEEQNEEEDKEDQQRIKEDRKYLENLEHEEEDMGYLRDPYNCHKLPAQTKNSMARGMGRTRVILK